MVGQVLGGLRPAAFLDVARAGHDVEVRRRQPAAKERCVEAFGNADRNVEAIFHDVDDPVGEMEVQVDFRV